MRFEFFSLKNQILLTALFFVLSLYGILHHEIWLDEAHHWLLAKDSKSIIDLIHNMRYEGHPILWNLLLYFVGKFTTNPVWMQILHVCISTTTVFLFLRYAPFKTVWKILFIFGYFMFFEYNLLSRNYMLGITFIFIACALFKHRYRYFFWYTLTLALATHVHAIFLIIASCFMLIELVELKKSKINKVYIFGWAIFGIAVVLSVISIIPPSDTTYFDYSQHKPFTQKFTFGIISILKGLLVLPDFTEHHFWNSNLIIRWNKFFAGIVLLITYVLPLIFFYKKRILLLFVYSGIVVANLFFFMTQLNSTRYDGLLFFIFFSALWLDTSIDDTSKYYLAFSPKIFYRIQNFSISVILTLQCFSGVMAYARDVSLPFDNSLNTVMFLKKEHLDSHMLITPSCEGSTISTYLGKKVHFLCANSAEGYCKWHLKCQIDHDWNNGLAHKINTALSDKKEAIFITKYPITESTSTTENPLNLSYLLLDKFEGSIIKNNNYFVYKVVQH